MNDTTTEARAKLAELMASHSALSPFSVVAIEARSGGATEWDKHAAHWRATFGSGDRNAFSVEYSRGSAYRKWKSGAGFMLRGEPGLSPLPPTPADALARVRNGYARALVMERSTPIPPDAVDVFSSLCMDASCYDGARDWREFSVEFGYGDDSVRGKKAYKSCERVAKFLRHALGKDYDAAMELAREL